MPPETRSWRGGARRAPTSTAGPPALPTTPSSSRSSAGDGAAGTSMKHVVAAIGALGTMIAGCGSTAPAIAPTDTPGDPGGTFAGGEEASAPGLSVAIGPAAPSVCPGDCVQLTAAASGGRAPYAFVWSPEATSGGGSITVCPDRTTTYSVNATDSSGSSGEIQRPNLAGSAKVT